MMAVGGQVDGTVGQANGSGGKVDGIARQANGSGGKVIDHPGKAVDQSPPSD
jgi:hypothetical protein